MIRMRTITQAAAELRNDDPNTAITEYAIRQLILSNQIHSIQRGRKYIINLESLISYLAGEKPQSEENLKGVDGIRPIPERQV